MMNSEKMEADYGKTRDVILSCGNWEQLKVAVRMFNQLNQLHDIPEKDLNKLENLIGLMRMKCGDEEISEETSKIGKEFRKYASQAGLNDIVFSEEEYVGGEADNMTPEDLAKKHDVDISDIKKEIGIGTQIEKEHTDDDAVAKEIAMDHIAEYPDYYSDENYGIVAIEKARGEGRKTVRISKKEMEKLHKEGKLDLEGISLSYSEDMDEATSAGASSGSYVGNGPFGDPITRTLKKSEIHVSVNGMNRPTGKMFSFNEDKEILEEDDLDEATTVGGVGGVYDTPGFAASKFMGTAGKKGKAPVKKKQPNDVLKNLGYQKVRVKKKCKKFPYCNQSPEAIEFYNESRVIKTIKKGDLKIKK